MADSQPADELEESLEAGDDMAIDQDRAGKRRRAGKEEAAAKAEVAAKAAMDKTEQAIEELQGKPPRTKREKERLALLIARLADHKDRYERAALARQSVYAEAAQKREAERSKAAAKEQRVLQEAALSENAEVQLVTLRLAKQSYFDNTSHKNADVWEAIAKEYNDLCEAGRNGLTAADARAASALIAKFSKYLNDFKKWADKANRAHARSGVPADEVLEKVSEHQRASTCAALIVYLYVYDNTHVCLGRVCTFSPPT